MVLFIEKDEPTFQDGFLAFTYDPKNKKEK